MNGSDWLPEPPRVRHWGDPLPERLERVMPESRAPFSRVPRAGVGSPTRWARFQARVIIAAGFLTAAGITMWIIDVKSSVDRGEERWESLFLIFGGG